MKLQDYLYACPESDKPNWNKSVHKWQIIGKSLFSARPQMAYGNAIVFRSKCALHDERQDRVTRLDREITKNSLKYSNIMVLLAPGVLSTDRAGIQIWKGPIASRKVASCVSQ